MPDAGRMDLGISSSAHLFFGLDFGLRRIGVAAGDSLTRQARPLTTLNCTHGVPDWPRLRELVEQWQPRQWIVGLPFSEDGSENAATARVRAFALDLARETHTPVCFADERYSSIDAAEHLRARRAAGTRKKRLSKGDVDSAAAVVILERWLSLRESNAMDR